MSRTPRRATAPPRFEPLEARTLLSVAAVGPVDPAASVLVRFQAGTTAGAVAASLAGVGGRVVTAYPDGPELVALPSAGARPAALRALKANPHVIYAEADGTFRAAGVPSAPSGPLAVNDPQALSQWGLGIIDAPYAWAVTTGTPATVVAVLDTGIDLKNPEFAGHLWTNPTANTDGYRGDTHGWNFVNSTGNLQDDNGHGSHVSGILGAQGNNGVGGAGIDWRAQIMPLKVLDSQGNGTEDAAISAIYFAVAHGARVINASWGGDTYSGAMLDALNYANTKGVVFVTAAGNDSANNDAAVTDPQGATTYPGSYRTPNELVVAAIDPTGRLADFSNYGATTVDLAAPGVGIVSTVPTAIDRSGVATYDGTSMATPFVSGTVALLAGLNPGMTADQLVARVRATAKPLPQLNGLLISPGVVDPLNALLNRTPLHPPATPPGQGVTATGLSAPATATPLSTVENGILATDSVYSRFGATASGYVAGLYQAIDGRAPTPGELTYYATTLQTGAARSSLIAKLQNSAEGRLTRVARWYINELGATAPVSALKSDPGVMIYAGMLANGASAAAVQGLMFGNVVASVGPTVGTPPWAVTFLFRGLLGRAPEPAAVTLFASELTAGTPVAQVARQILGSSEGRLTTIASLYRDELGSTAALPALKADSGVAYWASLLGTD